MSVAEVSKTNGNGKVSSVDAPTAQIQIDRIEAETIRVPIIGTTPLIMHRFSEKAKRQMLDNMQGRKSPKESKDPEAEYEAAFYRTEDGTPGFPATAFKKATNGDDMNIERVRVTPGLAAEWLEGLAPVVKLAYCVKTWNAWLAGEEKGLLRFRPGGKDAEVFPTVKGYDD